VVANIKRKTNIDTDTKRIRLLPVLTAVATLGLTACGGGSGSSALDTDQEGIETEDPATDTPATGTSPADAPPSEIPATDTPATDTPTVFPPVDAPSIDVPATDSPTIDTPPVDTLPEDTQTEIDPDDTPVDTPPQTSLPPASGNAGDLDFLGVVTIDIDQQQALGLFDQLVPPVPIAQFPEAISNMEDMCQVIPFDLDSVDDLAAPPTPLDALDSDDIEDAFIAVNAGEVITITSPAGSFGDLFIDDSDPDNIVYQSNTALPGGGIPAGTTMNIPGGTFPAIANVPVPAVPLLSDLSPANGTSLQGVEFTWTGSNNTDTNLINLGVLLDSSLISCFLVDDGSFTIPSNILSEAGDGSFLTFPSRFGQTFTISNNAMVVVVASTGGQL